jgi:hypothetical protein
MWEKVQKLLDRIESRWALWGLLGGGGIVTVAGSWLASSSAWLHQYGPYAWLVAGLLCGLLFAGIFSLLAWSRIKLAHAAAVRKWTNQVASTVNPLEREYHKKRILWSDLVHPVSRQIEQKQFTDCELIGPINIMLLADIEMSHVTYMNCDFVLVSDEVLAYNTIGLSGIVMRGGSVSSTTFFIHPRNLEPFKRTAGLRFLNLTGDKEIDSRLSPNPR